MTTIEIIMAIAIVMLFLIHFYHNNEEDKINYRICEENSNNGRIVGTLAYILLHHLGVEADTEEKLYETIYKIADEIGEERNKQKEQKIQQVVLERKREPKTELEDIYRPCTKNSIEDFYKALEEFMEDC